MEIVSCFDGASTQLTAETYGAAVSMLALITEQTKNNTVEQNSEVLGTIADYFMELATFVNDSNVMINTTVSHNLPCK